MGRRVTVSLSYTPIQWQHALLATYSCSKNANLWELMHKVTLRWYLTPYRLSKYYSQSSNLCWRNCGQIGTLCHVLWSCRSLDKFWPYVFQKLSEIIAILLQTSPGLDLLNLGIDEIPRILRNTAVNVLLAARLVLMRHWKSPLIPAMSKLVTLVHQHYTYERMYALATDFLKFSTDRWSPWVEWYENYAHSTC